MTSFTSQNNPEYLWQRLKGCQRRRETRTVNVRQRWINLVWYFSGPVTSQTAPLAHSHLFSECRPRLPGNQSCSYCLSVSFSSSFPLSLRPLSLCAALYPEGGGVVCGGGSFSSCGRSEFTVVSEPSAWSSGALIPWVEPGTGLAAPPASASSTGMFQNMSVISLFGNMCLAMMWRRQTAGEELIFNDPCDLVGSFWSHPEFYLNQESLNATRLWRAKHHHNSDDLV